MKIEWQLESNKAKVEYKHDLMSDTEIFLPDNIEYIFNITMWPGNETVAIKPKLFLGDVEIKLVQNNLSNGVTVFTSKINHSFFDNAHFFNYFGESQLLLMTYQNGEVVEYEKIINVTLRKEKASIAYDMLNYLSDNLEDISQVCFSKTRSGFKPKSDGHNNMVKIENLNKTIKFLESYVDKFSRNKKCKLQKNMIVKSDQFPVYDYDTTDWLTSNFDKLRPARKQDHTIIVNKNYYHIDLPINSYSNNTNQKENQAIHWFLLAGIEYCKGMIELFKHQENSQVSSYENNEYIRFDQVIKNSINPILRSKINKIRDTKKRLIQLKRIYDNVIPVKKLKATLPIQTSFTLKNKHYSVAFNLIKIFYESNHVDRSEDINILLGMRNLSQIYEFCCLYKIINGIKKCCSSDGGLSTTRFISHNQSWEGEQTMSVNVLANQFIFNLDTNRKITLYYEKPYYPVNSNNIPNNTIIRTSKSTKPYIPDYTLRLDNSITGEHQYIILDAKFKTKDNVRKDYKFMYSKYGQELKSVKDKVIDSTAIKYVGLLYGIYKNEKLIEDSFISEIHSPNGELPIYPYFSSFHLSVDTDFTITEIIKKYLL